jgi:hypothetical protein
VSVPGKTFQPSLMFLGKAGSLPKSGASFMCSTQESPCLDLRKSIIYGQKSFITLGPGVMVLKNLSPMVGKIKAGVFVPGRPFKFNPTFIDKARVHPRGEHAILGQDPALLANIRVG